MKPISHKMTAAMSTNQSTWAAKPSPPKMARISSKTISATNSTPPLMPVERLGVDYPVCTAVTQRRQSRQTTCSAASELLAKARLVLELVQLHLEPLVDRGKGAGSPTNRQQPALRGVLE
jgi:hypothetical protein